MNGPSPGWGSAKLQDVVDILDSRRVPINAKERENRQGQIPYYGATGQVGWIDDFLFDEELVLLGEDGAPFLDSTKQKAYVIRGKSWVNNHAHVLRARDGIPSAYIKYYLDVVDYHPFVTGTTRLKLNQAAMRQIPIPIAPPDQQKGIVAEIEKQFSRLDEAVANFNRIKANLKRYKAAILKAAVEGRLVETEAELARRERRSYETGSDLLRRVLQSRSPTSSFERKVRELADPTRNSPRHIPTGWAWATVEQIAVLVEYGSSAKTTDDAAGVPVLRMGNITDGQLVLSELKFLPTTHEEFPKLFLSEGDLLFNRTNSPELVGKTAVFHGAPEPCSFASYLIRARLADGLEPDFFAAYINSVHGRSWIKCVATQQVGQANVNGTKLRQLAVPLPPAAEQRRIVAEMARRLSLIDGARLILGDNSVRAANLRQGILATLFALET